MSAAFCIFLAAFSSLRSALRRLRSAFSAALVASFGSTCTLVAADGGIGIAFVPVPSVLDDDSFLDGPKPLNRLQ